MKPKTVHKQQQSNLSSSSLYLLPIPTLLISLMIFKLYSVTGNSKFLVTSIIIALISIGGVGIFLHLKAKEYGQDKNNPLSIFKTRDFEKWLINSGIYRAVSDEKLVIPRIRISMKDDNYYLDIQEFYMVGEKLLTSTSAINAYAHQQNCDMTIIECFRHKGFIRYHFIKKY